MPIAFLIAGSIAAAAPVADAWEQIDGSGPTILIQQRMPFILCLGVCVDSDLMVESSGLVLLRIRRAGHETETFRYRVPQDQVRRFWQLYLSIRPKGLKGPVGDCNTPEHRPIIDWDIRWQDKFGQSRLLACSGAPDVAKAWYNGFSILRISRVTGKRLTVLQAEAIRVP